MSKQLTLFGKVDKTQNNRSCIYLQPSNDYEQFVNYYYQCNKHQGRPRGAILKAAQTEWKNTYMKDRALLSKYLQPREGNNRRIVKKRML